MPNTGTISPTNGTGPSFAKADSRGLRLEEVSFAFGNTPTLDRVSVEVSGGSFFALLGASGCGKTTLLKLIGGYLAPSRGRIVLAGREITALPPEARQIGMVFQSYALFPHLSARDNVGFGLDVRGIKRAERNRRVEAILDRVNLSLAERDRRPGSLSGGQQQRVALARALVIEPDLLLLDEPLANLDRRLREQVRDELRRVQRASGVTTLLVTHDQEEALSLADGIGVMARGKLLQVSSPREVYERPHCPYVARLLGDANLLPVERIDGVDAIVAGGMRFAGLAAREPLIRQGSVVLLRPGRVSPGFREGACSWQARVERVTYRGGNTLVELRINETLLLAQFSSDQGPSPGEVIPVSILPGDVHPLPASDPPGLNA